jgi:flagellar assembly factor FliW
MQLKTTRFGTIDIEEENIFFFASGILGFPDCRRFILIPHPKGGSFQWLQSVDQAEVAFILTDPQLFVSDYRIDIRLEDIAVIEAGELEEVRVYVIVRVPPRPEKPSINLVGPILVNEKKKQGMQHVINNCPWSFRHEIG